MFKIKKSALICAAILSVGTAVYANSVPSNKYCNVTIDGIHSQWSCLISNIGTANDPYTFATVGDMEFIYSYSDMAFHVTNNSDNYITYTVGWSMRSYTSSSPNGYEMYPAALGSTAMTIYPGTSIFLQGNGFQDFKYATVQSNNHLIYDDITLDDGAGTVYRCYLSIQRIIGTYQTPKTDNEGIIMRCVTTTNNIPVYSKKESD